MQSQPPPPPPPGPATLPFSKSPISPAPPPPPPPSPPLPAQHLASHSPHAHRPANLPPPPPPPPPPPSVSVRAAPALSSPLTEPIVTPHPTHDPHLSPTSTTSSHIANDVPSIPSPRNPTSSPTALNPPSLLTTLTATSTGKSPELLHAIHSMASNSAASTAPTPPPMPPRPAPPINHTMSAVAPLPPPPPKSKMLTKPIESAVPHPAKPLIAPASIASSSPTETTDKSRTSPKDGLLVQSNASAPTSHPLVVNTSPSAKQRAAQEVQSTSPKMNGGVDTLSKLDTPRLSDGAKPPAPRGVRAGFHRAIPPQLPMLLRPGAELSSDREALEPGSDSDNAWDPPLDTSSPRRPRRAATGRPLTGNAAGALEEDVPPPSARDELEEHFLMHPRSTDGDDPINDMLHAVRFRQLDDDEEILSDEDGSIGRQRGEEVPRPRPDEDDSAGVPSIDEFDTIDLKRVRQSTVRSYWKRAAPEVGCDGCTGCERLCDENIRLRRQLDELEFEVASGVLHNPSDGFEASNELVPHVSAPPEVPIRQKKKSRGWTSKIIGSAPIPSSKPSEKSKLRSQVQALTVTTEYLWRKLNKAEMELQSYRLKDLRRRMDMSQNGSEQGGSSGNVGGNVNPRLVENHRSLGNPKNADWEWE